MENKIKNKLLISSITLIILSLIISVIVINKLTLDKPVFLKVYKDVDISKGENGYILNEWGIELKYISNIKDERQVISINFKESQDLKFDVIQNSNNSFGFINNIENGNEEIYGRYQVNNFYIQFSPMTDISKIEKETILKEATILFNDNHTMDVDLGKIALYKIDNSDYVLEGQGSSSSTDGSSRTIYSVKKDIEVVDVYSPLFDETRDLFDFSLSKHDNINSSDKIYAEKDYLYLNSMFYEIDDIERKLYSYDIKPIIYMKDKEGNELKQRVYNINREPIFTYKDIYLYLKSKGEI